jgi:hypothetical protein
MQEILGQGKTCLFPTELQILRVFDNLDLQLMSDQPLDS